MGKQMSALVIGGSRYFGRHIVNDLLNKGYSVTIANRGITPDDFGDRVKRIHFLREDRGSFERSFEGEVWDLVFDQICYSPAEALIACEFFANRIHKYFLTSSQSVYLKNGLQKEEDFNPYEYPIQMGSRQNFSYAEGKRLAEAVFFQTAKFPVTAVRLPFVLGLDDYTSRLEFHINHIKDGKCFFVPDRNVRTSMIPSVEAGNFISWLSDTHLTGPINACSQGEITIGQLIEMIEMEVGTRAILTSKEGECCDPSPYAGVVSRYLDSSKAIQAGFKFSNIKDWLPNLIQIASNHKVYG